MIKQVLGLLEFLLPFSMAVVTFNTLQHSQVLWNRGWIECTFLWMSSKISGVGSSWFSVSASFATKLSSIWTLGDACHRDPNQLLQHKNKKAPTFTKKIQYNSAINFFLTSLSRTVKNTQQESDPLLPPKISSEFVLKLKSFRIKY